MKHQLFRVLAGCVGAYHRCKVSDSPSLKEWLLRHELRIKELVVHHMPSGSGFDSGTKLLLDDSTEEKLVFETSFHHMDENGSYDGWTEHTVVITPSLAHNFHIRVTGRNRNDIKDLISDMFNESLTTEVE